MAAPRLHGPTAQEALDQGMDREHFWQEYVSIGNSRTANCEELAAYLEQQTGCDADTAEATAWAIERRHAVLIDTLTAQVSAYLEQQTGCDADTAEATAWAIVEHYTLNASLAECPLRQAVERRHAALIDTLTAQVFRADPRFKQFAAD